MKEIDNTMNKIIGVSSNNSDSYSRTGIGIRATKGRECNSLVFSISYDSIGMPSHVTTLYSYTPKLDSAPLLSPFSLTPSLTSYFSLPDSLSLSLLNSLSHSPSRASTSSSTGAAALAAAAGAAASPPIHT